MTDLTQELQGERDLVMAYVGGNKHGDRTALETQRRRVDQRLAALRSNLNDLRLTATASSSRPRCARPSAA